MGKRRRQKPTPPRVGADARTDLVANPVVTWTLALGAFAYGIAIAWSSLEPRPTTWGLDAPGYLAAPLRALTLAMVAGGVALLLFAAAKPSAGRAAQPAVPVRSGGRLRVWIPVLLLVAAALWLLRVRSYFLGDQQVWLDTIHADRFPLFSEPLAAVVWRGYVLLLRALAVPLYDRWLALLPVLCGIACAPLAWQISGYLSRDRSTRLLALVLIATLGTTQLYCGYFESYPVVTLAVLLYVWAALRHAHGEGSLLLVGVSLAVAVGTHLVALFLVPSYVFLVLRERTSAARRAGLLALPLLVAGAVAWLLEVRGANIVRPFEVLRVALLRSGQGTPQPVHLAGRLADLANLILLVMPVPALLLMSRTFAGSWRAWPVSLDRAFLMAAAIPGALVAAALALPGSPAQDWDLLSVTLLPAALLGIQLGVSLNPTIHSKRLRLGLAMLAFGQLLAFILVNADERAGIRRFKTIIDPSVAFSTHERAYANEKLVKYYLARQDADSTLVYAQRALQAEANPRFYANVGTALYNLGRYAEAAEHLEEAIRGGLERGEVYYQLGLCHMRQHHYAEALGRFQMAADLDAKPEYLHSLGMAMLATGDGAAAYSVWTYVREHWPAFDPTARALERHFGGAQQPAVGR